MKLLRNKTHKPLKISLEGGKVLHLGPLKTGQVSPQSLDRPSLRKLIDAGEIEIVGDGESAGGGSVEGGPLHESTHGHPQPTVVMPKGNR